VQALLFVMLSAGGSGTFMAVDSALSTTARRTPV
jgi:hypothetical protein